MTTVVVSEYGIAPANNPVDINRRLRREGYLNVYTQQGREYLDPWTSRAFAVADHQVAHIYVRDESDIARVAALVAELDGVDAVLDRNAQRSLAIDHPRAGSWLRSPNRPPGSPITTGSTTPGRRSSRRAWTFIANPVTTPPSC
ncbi:hypothetical protein NIIDMKKI_37890 [Mycobacterium kansasii]|uniref:Type I phosphodiesterase / nucleotide pyrophosphatase family protein n=1 Tax=Mycobacterium kansasii TaxID=1768 RepID=A0A7G1IEB1_MYCKA|nr:hypothetical protein NIIDMKKI_37890 [Mycobacterium kansasii]